MRSFLIPLTAGLHILSTTATALAPLPNSTLTPVSPELFATFQRYTRFSVASLATFIFGFGNCPSPPFSAALVAKISNAPTDTQAAIFRDGAQKEFILSFVGSSSIQDFVTDLNDAPVPTQYECPGCMVHGALYAAWNSVRDECIATLRNLTSAHAGYTSVVTGHSLGGALAAIAYPDIVASGIAFRATYTFGAFRAGNQQWADYVDKLSRTSPDALGNVYRVTHAADGVPGQPAASKGFLHAGTEFWEVDDGKGTQSAQMTFRCRGQEDARCSKSVVDENAFPITLDHLTYSGIRMIDGNECGLGSLLPPVGGR